MEKKLQVFILDINGDIIHETTVIFEYDSFHEKYRYPYTQGELQFQKPQENRQGKYLKVFGELLYIELY